MIQRNTSPWKSESVEECITTHLSNQQALKLNGALASGLYRGKRLCNLLSMVQNIQYSFKTGSQVSLR